jgi:hypothetical protein
MLLTHLFFVLLVIPQLGLMFLLRVVLVFQFVIHLFITISSTTHATNVLFIAIFVFITTPTLNSIMLAVLHAQKLGGIIPQTIFVIRNQFALKELISITLKMSAFFVQFIVPIVSMMKRTY